MLKGPNTSRTSNVVLNSFASCITNTPEKSTFTPEMSFSEIISQPRMFMQELISCKSFKEVKGFTDTNCWWNLNKEVDMVNSNLQLIDFTSISVRRFPDKLNTINSHSKKFKWASILGFPDKMLSVLPNSMFEMFQIHFFPPKSARRNIAHANFLNLVQEGKINPLHFNNLTELNFMENGSPPQLESKGIRAVKL